MFKEIDITEFEESFIKNIGGDFMLLAAGSANSFNMMTASWGAVGFIWNLPALFCVIRPERHTYKFTEANEYFTATFLRDEFKGAHKICGSKSGRDCDKLALSGLNAAFTELGNPYFKEARLVLECKKVYADFIKQDAFIDKSIYPKWYGAKDAEHKMYVAQILKTLIWE